MKNIQSAKRLAWSLTSDDAFEAFINNHHNAARAWKRLAEALELSERPTAQPEKTNAAKWPRIAS